MIEKMGLFTKEDKDKELYENMLRALAGSSIDYTLFFRKLSRFDGEKSNILASFVNREPLDEWLDKYAVRLEKETITEVTRHEKMFSFLVRRSEDKFNLDERILLTYNQILI